MTTKFKKGQAVFCVDIKCCAIISDHVGNGYSLNDKSTGHFHQWNSLENNLRSLHETNGFYVPEVGDERPKGYQVWGTDGWTTRMSVGAKITFEDSDKAIRFPLPPEALESEKWAREQESKNNTYYVSPEKIRESLPVCKPVTDGPDSAIDFTQEIPVADKLLGEDFDRDILEKCQAISLHFAKIGVKLWELQGVADRNLVLALREENKNLKQKQTRINWRPVTEIPDKYNWIIISVKDEICGCSVITRPWDDDSDFTHNATGWIYLYEINSPQFTDPTLDLVRKLRSCTEAEAVAILKERGV